MSSKTKSPKSGSKKSQGGRRRSRGNGGSSRTVQSVVLNPGNRRTVTKKSFIYDFEVKLSPGTVEDITISLVELLGAAQSKSCSDWYDEYKIAKVILTAVGVTTNGTKVAVDTIVSVPDINGQAPTNYSEILRMAGARVQPLSFNQGTILLGSVRPTIDATGSGNQYVTDWVSTDATSVNWYGFRVSSPSADATLQCVARAEVHFRGSQ